MNPSNPFPPAPQPSLSREEVIAYLVDLEAKGWQVYSEGDAFVIVLNDTDELRISPFMGAYCIDYKSTLGPSRVGPRAYNLLQFRLGMNDMLPDCAPTRTRTVAGEPASNFSRIAKLIGSAQVEATHDPYLDDKGLANLLTLVGLAHSASPNLRLLTGDPGAKGLTKPFVTAFFQQLGCTSGEIRKIASPKPHRRFLLLSGGQVLIMGMSLNHIDKNEAVSVENDVLDRPFFEAEWLSGGPL